MHAIKNIGYLTDTIFHDRHGFVEEHENYFAIRTPTNPSFWFGNFILFKRAPAAGDFDEWMEIHRDVFGDTLNHVTLAWDEPLQGFIDEFTAADFRTSNGLALSMSAYGGGASINPNITVRPLSETSEWEAIIKQQIVIDREDFSYPDDGGSFRRTEMKSLRAMAEEGHGNWWGAFDGNELVGGMGLYFDETRTIGRFQYVTTRASHRRQRVCTTLLDRAVRHAFETVKVKQLVICTGAEDSNPAIPAYQQFGFREAVRSYALTSRDPTEDADD